MHDSIRSTLIVSFSAGPNESIGSRSCQSEIEELKNITLTFLKEFISFSNLVKLDMAAVKGDLAAVKGDLAAVQNNLTSLWSELGRVGDQVKNTNGKVTTNKRLIKAQASTLDGVQNTLSGVQSAVIGVQNTVNGVESKLDGMESELADQKGDMSANFNHTLALFNRLSSGQEVLYQNLSSEVKTDDSQIQEQLNSLQQVVETQVLDQGEVIASCCNRTSVQIDQLADRQETLYLNISADMSSLCLPPSNDPPTTIEPPTTASEPPTSASEPPTSASTATATEPPTDMGYTCGGTSGWRRAVFLNMTDPTHNCPSGWVETGYTKRTCGRATESAGGTCDSATFPTGGLTYSRVCGRAVGYQFGALSAFYGSSQNIESHYVNGLSLTHGRSGSRQHIWTFVGGVAEAAHSSYHSEWCPCDGGTSPVPDFLGNDYFCESGINGPWAGQFIFHPDDQLWDGRDCLPTSSCCSLNNPPYFIKEIGVNTNDDIEGRICATYALRQYSNTAIELLEIYVQ